MINILLAAAIYIGYHEFLKLQNRVIILEMTIAELRQEDETIKEDPKSGFELLFNNLGN